MDETRLRCIQKTMMLCSTQGLDFTMQELASALGMSKKTIYVLFASKEQLLEEMVDYMFDAVKESEAQVLADDTLSLPEKVRRLVIVLPESFKTLNWSNLQGMAEAYPQLYRRVCRHLETGWEPTLALLQQGIDQGTFRPFSLGVFRAMVEGSIEHFLTSDALQRAQTSYVQGLETMMDLLLDGIRGEALARCE